MSEQVFHIGIKALVVDDANRILMLKEVFPDGGMQWDIPGGRVDPGEIFKETLSRELHEEIGVEEYESAEHFATVLSNKHIRTDQGYVALTLIVFKVTLPSTATPQALEEGVELSWQSIDQATELLLDKYPEEFVEALAREGGAA